MDDLLNEFLTETAENLSVLDVELVRLEQTPDDPELLGNIFRLVHTIKGTCGFLGLPRLEAVAHAGENVLGKIRDGELEVTAEAVSLVLAALDQIKEILATLEETEAEPEGDDKALIARLNALAEAAGKDAPAEASAAEMVDFSPQEAAQAPAEAAEAEAAVGTSLFDRIGGAVAVDAAVDLFYRKVLGDERISRFFESVDMEAQHAKQKAFLTMAFGGPNGYTGTDLRTAHAPLVADGLNEQHFDAVAEHLKATLDELGVSPDLTAEVMDLVAGTRDDVLGGPVGEVAAPAPATPAVEAAPAAAEKAPTKKTTAPKESAVAAQSIRVNVDLLESLMTTVSELVLTRNQLLQILRQDTESDFGGPLQRLNHITTELQEGVMKTRMQPIGNAWAKIPRLVRDLALELGKKIELEMLGADTELDRQVLELIKDPLTHMVRNSADHGLEGPETRKAAGKSEVGTVTLNAYHEGGHIIIEIKDDGAGLPIEKLKAKALANGLTTEAEIESLTDQQIQKFIFKAGFSTAEKVTSVSGRGVGMDVVCTNIEKIGGTIELKSEEGKGTTFIIKIPLTLAIVSALIIESGGERFAIPQISVLELVRASANSANAVETINNTPVLRLRNRLLPLVSLRDMLKLAAPEGSEESKEDFIVVTQVGTYTFGIIVDRVFDTEEIVVKPVAPILRDISIFSGNTILGDGSVIMILDPNGIAAETGQATVRDTDADAAAATQDSDGPERVPLLLFRAGDASPKAVPLALVARLEEVQLDKVEYSQGAPVVQYRGHLMPLVMINDAYELKSSGRQPVLVFSDQGRTMGLVVDEIVDIVEEPLSAELNADRPGLIGSCIVCGKATDIIDAGFYLTRAFGDWFSPSAQGAGGAAAAGKDGKRILVVDDSPFFLNLLTPLLSVAGYTVTTAENANAAMKLCEEGRDFDIIISDIEMPGMSGFEFAEAVKHTPRWQDTPLVALSSHTSKENLDRGREVGFTDYVPKFDRDALLQTLSETLAISGGAA